MTSYFFLDLQQFTHLDEFLEPIPQIDYLIVLLEVDPCSNGTTFTRLMFSRYYPSKCPYPYALQMLSLEARLAQLIFPLVI